MKVLSLFSGIGAFEKALTRQCINYELVNYCEIDKFASKAYSLMHNISEDKNLGDITKVNIREIPNFDLMTWGFPCQDISIAGKQQGLIDDEGNKTRSGLYYDGLRILQYKKPKYSIIENVKALTQTKFRKQFEQMLYDLDVAGYNSYWQVLNAKDYGIPQNRERVFIVCIRKDINQTFIFPKEFELRLRLQDILEQSVDEKFYIKPEKIKKVKFNNNYIQWDTSGKGYNSQQDRAYYPDKFLGTLPSSNCGNKINVIVKGCSFRTRSYIGQSQQLEIRKDDLSNAITTIQKDSMIIKGMNIDEFLLNYRVRNLIPLESWRLMGFDDDDFYKVKDGLNNTFFQGKDKSKIKLYKLAGNSIVVNVLEQIFVKLFKQNITTLEKAL